MIGLLVGLLIACLVLGLVWYCLGLFSMPPIRTIAVIVFAIICVLVLLQYVPLGGLGFHSRC